MTEQSHVHPDGHRQRIRTIRWVVLLSTITLVFDGYDLVVYGAVVPALLRNPGQLGALSPPSRPERWAVMPWSA